MANELMITKEQTAKFVHDATEMETAVFTLDRAIAECEKRKKDTLSHANQNKQKANEDVKRLQKQINEIKSEHYTGSYRESFDASGCFSHAIGGLFIGFMPSMVIVTLILYLIAGESWLNNHMLAIFIPAIVLAIVSGIIVYSIKIKVKNSDFDFYNDAFERAKEKELNQANLELSTARSNVTKADYAVQAAQNQAALLTTQIADLRAKRNQVQSTLSRFYDLGVIPPDYRYMDCAIILDQIFRNDLADTMREAIRIYEERVFRGEVIKGMDRICSMLGNLSAGMMAIEQRLSSIDSNVKMMSQDLYTFSERIARGQERQEKATAELLNETQMSRYAAERVAESAKNLEWFERRRQGWV